MLLRICAAWTSMEKLKDALEYGDVAELQDAIRHAQATALPPSAGADKLLARARHTFRRHLSACKAYLQPLRRACTTRQAREVRHALMRAHAAPAQVKLYMYTYLMQAEVLHGELVAAHSAAQDLLRCRDCGELDIFLQTRARWLSDAMILKLVERRDRLQRRTHRHRSDTRSISSSSSSNRDGVRAASAVTRASECPVEVGRRCVGTATNTEAAVAAAATHVLQARSATAMNADTKDGLKKREWTLAQQQRMCTRRGGSTRYGENDVPSPAPLLLQAPPCSSGESQVANMQTQLGQSCSTAVVDATQATQAHRQSSASNDHTSARQGRTSLVPVLVIRPSRTGCVADDARVEPTTRRGWSGAVSCMRDEAAAIHPSTDATTASAAAVEASNAHGRAISEADQAVRAEQQFRRTLLRREHRERVSRYLTVMQGQSQRTACAPLVTMDTDGHVRTGAAGAGEHDENVPRPIIAHVGREGDAAEGHRARSIALTTAPSLPGVRDGACVHHAHAVPCMSGVGEGGCVRAAARLDAEVDRMVCKTDACGRDTAEREKVHAVGQGYPSGHDNIHGHGSCCPDADMDTPGLCVPAIPTAKLHRECGPRHDTPLQGGLSVSWPLSLSSSPSRVAARADSGVVRGSGEYVPRWRMCGTVTRAAAGQRVPMLVYASPPSPTTMHVVPSVPPRRREDGRRGVAEAATEMVDEPEGVGQDGAGADVVPSPPPADENDVVAIATLEQWSVCYEERLYRVDIMDEESVCRSLVFFNAGGPDNDSMHARHGRETAVDLHGGYILCAPCAGRPCDGSNMTGVQ